MLYQRFDRALALVFGEALRLARLGVRESQADFAERVGFTRKRLGLIERGWCSVRPSERAAVVAAFPSLAAIVLPHRERKPVIQGRPAGPHAPRPLVAADPEPA